MSGRLGKTWFYDHNQVFFHVSQLRVQIIQPEQNQYCLGKLNWFHLCNNQDICHTPLLQQGTWCGPLVSASTSRCNKHLGVCNQVVNGINTIVIFQLQLTSFFHFDCTISSCLFPNNFFECFSKSTCVAEYFERIFSHWGVSSFCSFLFIWMLCSLLSFCVVLHSAPVCCFYVLSL